jgi:hypothetical protein
MNKMINKMINKTLSNKIVREIIESVVRWGGGLDMNSSVYCALGVWREELEQPNKMLSTLLMEKFNISIDMARLIVDATTPSFQKSDYLTDDEKEGFLIGKRILKKCRELGITVEEV